MEKEKFDEKIRICPCCKQEYKTQIGMNNWKNLFRKPTIDDWVTLFILIMLLVAAFAYTTETKQCRETLQNLDRICLDYAKMISNTTYTETSIAYFNNPTTTTNPTTIGGEK
jgi:hypothetical protein